MTDNTWSELDERAIKMAKALSADAVQKAGHGHPGSPISLAPIAYTLYQRFIKHDPNDPNWAGRDRFILSGGHASLTQYVQLYFSGYGLTLDDLKYFRGGADTRTPGHPEYGLTPGIEMTTGPLGQGVASAVGFAYGQRYERGLLDPDAPEGKSPFDHKVWVICGEGDIEEGVSGEASSLAGNEQLGNLFVFFDANHIQIEGETKIALDENVIERYKAYGWYTDEFSFIQPDGSYKEDIEGLSKVIEKAEQVTDRPHFIKVDTLIAWPTPGKTNDPSSHGLRSGRRGRRGSQEGLGLDPTKTFEVDEEALAHAARSQSAALRHTRNGDDAFEKWADANPDKAALYNRIKNGELPEEFDKAIGRSRSRLRGRSKVATRKASGAVINAIAPIMPELWGAPPIWVVPTTPTSRAPRPFAPAEDATTQWPDCSPYGRQLHFGGARIRHGLHHQRPSCWVPTPVRSPAPSSSSQITCVQQSVCRLSWRSRTCTFGSHDSVALGEDGPTHQPIEHLSSFRDIPQLEVVRPADEWETAEAYRYFFEKKNTLPTAHGADPSGCPDPRRDRREGQGRRAQGCLRALRRGRPAGRGSSWPLARRSSGALEGAKKLAQEGIKASVISMVSMESVRGAGRREYKEEILPKGQSRPASPSKPAPRCPGTSTWALMARPSPSTSSACRATVLRT